MGRQRALALWDSFVANCETHGLDAAKKLFEVAGSLKEYETGADEGELHDYLGFRLEVYLIDCEAEQRQKEMQTKFDDDLRKLKCSECGRHVLAMFLDDDYLRCPCGHSYELKCPNCHGKLLFKEKKGSFACHRCNLFFTTKLRPIDRSRFLLL